MSSILITGAGGFIGSQLAHRLWQEGNHVILLDNFSYGSNDNLIFDDHTFSAELRSGDFRDIEFLDKLFAEEKFDVVYHMGGITPLPDCQNNPAAAVDVNVRGTTILLDMVRKHGVGHFVFASTSAVYENNRDFPSVEEHVERPSLIYPSTKYAAEQFCKAFADAYGIPVVCLRFANVYGPHIDCLRTQPPVMGYIIREFFRGNSPILHSTGEQKRDFVYVDDLIDMVIRAGSAEEFDIVNVSTGTAVTINEITAIIAEEMNCTHIPVKYAEVGHFWANYPELYEGPYPISTATLEHEVIKYTCLSNRHAREKYGWEPKTDLRQGIRNTIDFSLEVLRKNDKG